MAQIIYLMNATKKTIPKTIMILMHLKRLESFLIKVEVIVFVKKERELEMNFIKKKLFIVF